MAGFLESGILPPMSLDALVMFLGALVAVLPFLGFPTVWDTYILLILGILIVACGIVVRRRLNQKFRKAEQHPRTFAESAPHSHE